MVNTSHQLSGQARATILCPETLNSLPKNMLRLKYGHLPMNAFYNAVFIGSRQRHDRFRIMKYAIRMQPKMMTLIQNINMGVLFTSGDDVNGFFAS